MAPPRHPGLRPRKVRRGTSSCWECRRRKVRCTFDAGTTMCTPCERRGAECIGQQLQPSGHGNSQGQSANYDNLSRSLVRVGHYLLSVMPPPGTTQEILRKAGYADLLIKMIRKTYGECPEFSVQGQPLASFDIPDPTAHPISIVRNLLLIALSLQIREEVVPSSSKNMVLSQSSKESSHRYFNAATRNVTSKDQLVTSPEGLETLMLEGLYQITSGNLQLGCLTFRRVIGIAQLIGLASESQECAESDWDPTKTCTVSTSSFLWFRLNYSDRFLSLIMGLPFATSGDGFASPEVLAADAPMGRLERMHTVVMGHLISRNQRIARAENTQHALRTEAKETQHIDEELFQISAQFPRKWWLSPHLERLMPQAADSMNETLRLFAQMNQAHLLLALHVPYAMHAFSAGPQPDYSYNMQNTIQASRDLLCRFVLYRESNRMPYVDSNSGRYLTVFNPKDGTNVSDQVSLADDKDVDDAVNAAETAFPAWRKTLPNVRRDMLLNLATLVLKHADSLSAMSRLTFGAPVSAIGALEVAFAVDVLRYFAGWTDKLAGATYPEEDGFFKFVRQEPLGVTAGIIPWNAPTGGVYAKAAPALATGNCIILKLSEKTPFAGLAIGTKQPGFLPAFSRYCQAMAAQEL
ncbi:hypothetical protein CEP53_004423 [Fusarium sp. AF-6]|nr:hypothetical protein CEP53_004423 [Fusarium sp. AF-6]